MCLGTCVKFLCPLHSSLEEEEIRQGEGGSFVLSYPAKSEGLVGLLSVPVEPIRGERGVPREAKS